MTQPVWLTRAVVEAIHVDQVREHGGSQGIHDEGLLESALARPRNLHAYEGDADLAALAASYGHGIVTAHPFIDGNKRVALMAIYTFLALNGRELDAPQPEAVDVMMRLAAGELDEESLADWIRQQTTC